MRTCLVETEISKLKVDRQNERYPVTVTLNPVRTQTFKRKKAKKREWLPLFFVTKRKSCVTKPTLDMAGK